MDTAAIILLSLAGLTLVAWWQWTSSRFVQAWGPPIGTDLVFAAATLAVVERLLEQRNLSRQKPRTRYALGLTENAIRVFVEALGADYAQTHLANYLTLPNRLEEVIVRWRDGLTTTDTDRRSHNGGTMLDTHLKMTARELNEVRLQHEEVLSPELVVAIASFNDTARSTEAMRVFSSALPAMVDTKREVRLSRMHAVSERTLALLGAFQEQAGGSPLLFSAETISEHETMRQRLIEEAQPINPT